jgi:hypothetical protein
MLPADLTRAIEHNFEAVRKALAERRYPDAQELLAHQRDLFGDLNIVDPEARELLHRALDFVNSALVLAKVQHAHTERAFASLLKLKQLDAGYLFTPVCSAELVSVRG